MKTIKEHGYAKYLANCHRCNCVFEYELVDITDEGAVVCPDCGEDYIKNDD